MLNPAASSDRLWRQALAAHDAEVAALTDVAATVSPGGWLLPVAPGAWSPAQIVEHLCLAFETLGAELDGAPGMALRTRSWQRLLLSWFLRPRLLAGAPFPRAVRAPRELRPSSISADAEAGIQRFTACARRFRAAAEVAHEQRPGTRLTHAYFGSMPLVEAVRFAAVHVRHHRAQLAAAAAAQRDPTGPEGEES